MRISSKNGRESLGIVLSFLIVFQFVAFPVQAQSPAPPQILPTELNITVVQGEGTVSKTRERAAKDPVVQVEDENHRPLAGAAVVFTLPTEGATGVFGNGGKTLTVTTDPRGRATGQGLKLNEYPGKVVIHINASYRGLSVRTNITQFSEGPAVAAKPHTSGGHTGKILAIVALAGAAAAGGAYFGLRNNGSTGSSGGGTTPPPGTTPIGLTPGTGTITGPH
jgi:hypothetical protein